MHIDVENADSIKIFLKSCSKEPGIYKMISSDDEVIYVGKAKNLSKRLASYFAKNQKSTKVSKLVSQIYKIETTVTNTEAEALILECNLIKELKPKYNILLRDDKSYPYICLSYHNYPRLFLYRGKKINNAECFGPYPNVNAAKQTIRLLQQVFLIRVCSDNYYNNRTRPCLLHQINRCSAPCVKYINKDDYDEFINNTRLFLKGCSQELIKHISNNMSVASEQKNYEQAAYFRDQIIKLKQVAQGQFVETTVKVNMKPIDVVALQTNDKLFAVAILKFREGKLITSNQYIVKNTISLDDDETQDVILSVLSQYYLNYSSSKPDEIIINLDIKTSTKALLAELLNNDKLNINYKSTGIKLKWLNLAVKNADELINRKADQQQKYVNKFETLKKSLDLAKTPSFIECFDVSHTFGKQTIASCVIFDHNGPKKDSYRRYNIKLATGDDVFAIKQVLTRRYKKLLDTSKESELPGFILIDGGKAQINAVKMVLHDLGINNINIFGITKGIGRKASNDRIISAVNLKDIYLKQNSEALHLLQELRDEAHRFALVGHRKKRGKEQLASVLDEIPGVGAKRRRNLLSNLGGWQQVYNANKDELSKVPGISLKMAELIYDYLHK